MVRLFLILSIIIIVLTVWLSAVTGFANTPTLPIKNKITSKMVFEKVLDKYDPCIMEETYKVKEAYNLPMETSESVTQTILIVKGCDLYLTDIMNWLASEGEPSSMIQNWANDLRRYYLNMVFELLNESVVVEKEGEHKEGSHHNHE